MPRLRTYNLFISHAWPYNYWYHRLVELLDEAPLFRYRDYSVPEDNPLFTREERVPDEELIAALDRHIRPVHAFLVSAGMFVAHREWLQTEISIARKYDKPIIGVRPQGQIVVPRIVKDEADKIVGGHTPTIVRAIREWAI